MSQEKIPEKVQEAIFVKLLAQPANGQCADCPNKSPTWVSLDFGVFVCIRCSGVHRQIGPHITRVRSTRLDGWTKENIDIMVAVGNKIANDYYENRLPGGFRKPAANSSPEECRRFVDDKYIRKTFALSGHLVPVKEYLSAKSKGAEPDFSYSTGASGQNQNQNDHARHHSSGASPTQLNAKGPMVVRKKSMSLDKGNPQAHKNHHQNHDLLNDDDFFGNTKTNSNGSHDDFGDFKQAHGHGHSQSASPPKSGGGFPTFHKTNSEHQAPATTQWDWNFGGNTSGNTSNNTQAPAQNNTANNQGFNFQAQNQGQQQHQPQQNTQNQQQQQFQQQQLQQQQQQPQQPNLMSLYNQKPMENQNWNFQIGPQGGNQGMHPGMNQGMKQGMNAGFQGGMNAGFNGQMGMQGQYGNFNGQQMGGFPQQQMGFNGNMGNMGSFGQMGFNQGFQQNQGLQKQQQNQFGFNQQMGFPQQQNANKFF